MENELPLGSRSRLYRAFEMLPAAVSYGMLVLVVILPLFSPRLAAMYVLGIVVITLFRAARGAVDAARGFRRVRRGERTDWSGRLDDFVDPAAALRRPDDPASTRREVQLHRRALARALWHPNEAPHPDDIVHAVIVAAYNEPYEVIAPTIRSLVEARPSRGPMVVFLAYEERGGAEMARTARRLRDEFHDAFRAFELAEHPRDLPGEIAGKGANISCAGAQLARWTATRGIEPSRVIVTTLDCDNKPHPQYFDAVSAAFLAHPHRTRTSFQPVSLFLNNIWDAPAPSRVVASGNSLWNLISAVRPGSLRNFASHSQPLDALIEMDFWSRRTIVEDGHQYWRSYFHFRGDYEVVPIPLPIYQDAVMAHSYRQTLVAQFQQLSRWSYGASDVPYVAVRVFGPYRPAPFWPSLRRFLSLLEGHVTLASLAIIVAIGGWIPVALATPRARLDELVENLPVFVSSTQQIAMLGLIVSIALAWRLLPPRPERHGRARSLGMILQWLLFPLTMIAYNAVTALVSQGQLALGAYRERFDVTVKSAVPADREA